MSNILIPAGSNLTGDEMKKQQSNLRHQKDMMMIEAISRSIGHTDWQYDQISHLMETREYPDNSSVFSFRGKDMLLFEPPLILDGHLTQPVQYLYDRTDFKYMTFEERADLGYPGYEAALLGKEEDAEITELDKVRAGILDDEEDSSNES
jgi:hypothetical protein